MRLNRIDRWTAEDINKILANIKENSEAKEAAYLERYSDVKDTDIYPEVQRNASFHARLYSEEISYDYNQSIRVDVFRNNDTAAEVEVLFTEDKEENYILQHFDFVSEDGENYHNDSFDKIYCAVWKAEIRHNESLPFALNAVNHEPDYVVNLTDEYLRKAVSQYSPEKIANDFLTEASIFEVLSCLNLNREVALSVKIEDFQQLTKDCIMNDKLIAIDCLKFLISRCEKSYPLNTKSTEKQEPDNR